MTSLRLALLLLVACGMASPLFAAALPKESRVPGGVALIPIPGEETAPLATVEGRRAAVIRHDNQWLAVIGIPLDATPGEQNVRVQTPQGAVNASFKITDKRYKTQHLTVKARQVDPLPEDLKRIAAERERSDTALSRFTPDTTTSFVL